MQGRLGSVLVGLVLALIVGGQVYYSRPSTTPSPTPTGTTPSPTPTGTTKGGITLAQVAQHADRNSCWSAINGSVYDLTSWIPNHPGGEENILRICGKDGSSLYNAQHGGSSRPASILAGFKIGTLQ